MKKIYNYLGIVKIAILCCTLFFSTFAFGQFYKPGNVPTVWPTGGFGVEGDTYKNLWFYPDSAVNNVGDWFPYVDPNAPVGTGGSIFDASGNLITTYTPSQAIIANFLDKFKKDPGGDQSVFAMSDKINDNPNTYNVKPGSVPQKDDIQHAVAVFTYGDPNLVPVIPPNPDASETGYVAQGNPNDLWCEFMGDRWVTNGDSYIDFEFNQNAIIWDVVTGNFTTLAPVLDANGDPTGGRTPGDLLLTIHFVTGGSAGEVFVDKWLNDGLHTPYSWHSQNVMLSPYMDNLFLVFNNTVDHVPWKVYDEAVQPDGHYEYVINQFAEGALNLTQTMLGSQDCGTIATVWARTKSSHSSTAQLKDLAGILNVNITPPKPVVTCPDPVDLPACTSLEDVQAAWDEWIDGFSFTDGTGPFTETFDPELPESLPAGVECGWTFETEYKVVDHCDQADSCESTFTVGEPPDVVFTCATDLTVAACQTQAQVDAEFAAWLLTTTASGGCNGELSNNATTAPPRCGGFVDVTWTYTSSCDPLTTTCTKRFTVTAPATVVINCATDLTVASCQTQAQVDAEFAAWLLTTTASGGCDGSLTNNAGSAPPRCGGYADVTWTYTSSCAPLTTTCTKRFTVTAPPTVVFTCASDLTVASCQTQAQVDAEFAAWLLTTTASGGCNGSLTNNNTGAPPRCGGYRDVTWTYTSSCAPLTTSCTKRFTVTAPPTVVFNCASDLTVASCQTQAAVDAEFAAWLLTTTASGGCNGSLTNNAGAAPPRCGGYTDVTWTYTSSCAPLTTTCTKRFTVTAPPTVVFNCASNLTVAACQTQAQVDAEFAAWLLTTTASGGCNGSLTNNAVAAPPRCGGFVDVTWTYTSTCAPLTTQCTKRFTVTAPATVTLNCASDLTVGPCQSQGAINGQFAAWLLTTTASGGCDGSLTNNAGGAPPRCGGYTDVTWTYTSSCAPFTTTCTKRFTVTAPAAVVFNCASDLTVDPCQTQAEVDAEFAAWLLTTTASGGCDGSLTNNATTAPPACGGFVDVTWTYTSSCAPLTTSCTKRFTVTAAPTLTVQCPDPVQITAFEDQAIVDAAFDAWIAGFTSSGGCNPDVPILDYPYPSNCGDTVEITFTVTDDCGQEADCSSSFMVSINTDVTMTCPDDVTEDACLTQAEIDLAFTDWLDVFSYQANCDPVLTIDPETPTAPDACGGETTVTWTVTQQCEPFVTTCTRTFTVEPPAPIEINCPNPVALGDCTPSLDIIAAYDAWKAGFTSSGDCNLTDNLASFPPLVVLPDGSVSLSFTYIVTGDCDATEHTCSSTFTAGPCAPNCETAFGKLDEGDAVCFLADGFSRWGWTNYIPEEGSYVLPLYSGAAKCNISDGELVGTVYVDYLDGALTVTYLMDAGFALGEVHVNVACDKYPVGPNGKPTVAPGQYIFGASGLDMNKEVIVTFTDVSGPVWVIVHGQACDIEGDGTAEFEYTDPINCSSKESPVIKPQPAVSDAIDVNIHPNPFIGSTDIEFTIPWSGEATVDIYNALGDKVVTLFNETVVADQKYIVRFTAPDQSGQGMFLCVIRSGKGYVVKHMIMNR